MFGNSLQVKKELIGLLSDAFTDLYTWWAFFSPELPRKLA